MRTVTTVKGPEYTRAAMLHMKNIAKCVELYKCAQQLYTESNTDLPLNIIVAYHEIYSSTFFHEIFLIEVATCTSSYMHECT